MEKFISRISSIEYATKVAFIDSNSLKHYSYQELAKEIEIKKCKYLELGLNNKSIILDGDFNFASITTFLALLQLNNIITLGTDLDNYDKIIKLVGADYYCNPVNDKLIKYTSDSLNDLMNEVFTKKESGIILLSSGTTGTPKAILHSVKNLFRKYELSNKAFTTMGFLLFDHIAGLDTMLYTFAAGGCLVNTREREPEIVLELISKFEIEVFPTSPSFINLLLFYNEFNPKKLANLKIITFGSERISESSLNKLKSRFDGKVKIVQKYGLTEMGSPIVKSNPDDPSWIKIDTRMTKFKIEDGILFLKSRSSMVGYIYHDKCEKFDGWFNTHDKVEVKGEWIKILGRDTDIINVGGQKVYPSEVESVLMDIDNVKDASVISEENPILGSIVVAKLILNEDEKLSSLRKKVRMFCKDKLEPFKIPAKIIISKDSQISKRLKKVRK